MAAIRFLVVALAIVMVPACDDDDDIIIITDPVGETVDEGFARGEILAAQAAQELTPESDFNVVIGKTATILATLNDGEIDQASFAVQVVGAPDVFDLANRILIEHEDLNQELDGVVRFYNVPYLPSSTADALAAEATANLGILRATPPADIDFVYTELQVIQHAAALVLLDELAAQVGPGEMRDFISNTAVIVDAHLDQAEAILETFY